MKKLKLIYNPFSGNKSFKFDLDVCIGIFQDGGFEVHPFRTMTEGDITKHIEQMPDDYDLIVASGGDGTVNIVLNAMMRRKMDIPLGIIPSGTANDFATFLGFKSGQVEDACHAIANTHPVAIDLGLVNGTTYFINVCAGGLLTNVSQTVDKDLKNVLGSLSYYLKGVEQIPNFHKIPFRITTSSQVVEEDLYLYMIMNSAGTGGFTKLSPQASIQDGMFELIAIRGRPLIELSPLFLKMLTGDHINDTKNILYLRDSYFKIECLADDFKIMESTVDGEMGPRMPFEVKVIPKAIRVFVNPRR
ncbi:MAG TPA: diacylglycerol kinase [Clostridium sp.]|jgi:YegS/Rv2252/BmrU family lipid kinase|uniref:Diacylglycerol kinase n=3 Tax=root TaxID=1 RepID=A0A120MJY9_ANAPI|nr:YegS/Rv2252/BmrU family lipid kinase [Anaerotignum propionicum]AMJ39638.1 diacylglycerol kinase [Anaerotignum propionicum DSM 1682]SHE31388.1 lipid kinase, YegS/Rv2252/BmrU family [[Clostridium] propionicum DSM 1682] [Anaerotignum propionicum DSM 1682]HBF66059.1 diacylglycerol kinase [Clostridium sp.]